LKRKCRGVQWTKRSPTDVIDLSEFRALVREVRILRIEHERSRLLTLARSFGKSKDPEVRVAARTLVPEAFSISTLTQLADRLKEMEEELEEMDEADGAQEAAAGPST